MASEAKAEEGGLTITDREFKRAVASDEDVKTAPIEQNVTSGKKVTFPMEEDEEEPLKPPKAVATDEDEPTTKQESFVPCSFVHVDMQHPNKLHKKKCKHDKAWMDKAKRIICYVVAILLCFFIVSMIWKIWFAVCPLPSRKPVFHHIVTDGDRSC